MSDVVVLGRVGRDLVLRVAAVAGAVVVAEELGVDPVRGDGDVLVPLLGERPVDATGAGDASVATLTAAQLGGAGPEDAAWAAGAAAGCTVAHAGGRPDLSPGALREVVRRHRPV
jgi:ribokinase